MCFWKVFDEKECNLFFYTLQGKELTELERNQTGNSIGKIWRSR